MLLLISNYVLTVDTPKVLAPGLANRNDVQLGIMQIMKEVDPCLFAD